MSKTLLLAAAAGLTLALGAGPAAAGIALPTKPGANDVVALCKFLLEEEPGFYESLFGTTSLGACVSAPAKICQDPEGREFVGFIFGEEFRNTGQCVSFIRHLDLGDL